MKKEDVFAGRMESWQKVEIKGNILTSQNENENDGKGDAV